MLLIRFTILRIGSTFVFGLPRARLLSWCETDLEAARCEVAEELAIKLPLTGPVHSSVDRFIHKGVLVANTDVFSVGRPNQKAPQLHATAEDERAAVRETRWWSTGEIEGACETIFPRDLVAIIRR